MFVKGNPIALQVIDYNLSFPLHIACEYSSFEVVKQLLQLDDSYLNHLHKNKDSVLHCGANFDVIKILLETGTAKC